MQQIEQSEPFQMPPNGLSHWNALGKVLSSPLVKSSLVFLFLASSVTPNLVPQCSVFRQLSFWTRQKSSKPFYITVPKFLWDEKMQRQKYAKHVFWNLFQLIYQSSHRICLISVLLSNNMLHLCVCVFCAIPHMDTMGIYSDLFLVHFQLNLI